MRLPSTDRALGLVVAATFLALLLGRVWLAAALPLTDTTEARFGEMARQMTASGDWLVPQHDDGVPYLAKPPLAMWLSAAGIELLGANELGPRLPILICSLLLLGFVYRWARAQLGPRVAVASVAMLSSSFLFFTASAAVMTDMVLTACVSVALFAFWEKLHGGRQIWAWVLFAALGLGLLAKGPLAGVLVFVPMAAWTFRHGSTRTVLHAFPWLAGLSLTAAIAVPWYVAAELRNPGFLEYFLIGEHLGRFLVSGWQGDLYGRAHALPRGTVWLFFLIGALPWSLSMVPITRSARAAVKENWQNRRRLIEFLGLAALCPLLLFTFSGNVIFPYALPSLPFAAALAAALTVRTEGPPSRFPASAMAATTLILLIASVFAVPFAQTQTQEPVIAKINANPVLVNAPIYYWQARYFSAEYYSRGVAQTLCEPAELTAAVASRRPFSLVVARKQIGSLPAAARSRLQEVESVGDFAVFAPAGAGG